MKFGAATCLCFLIPDPETQSPVVALQTWDYISLSQPGTNKLAHGVKVFGRRCLFIGLGQIRRHERVHIKKDAKQHPQLNTFHLLHVLVSFCVIFHVEPAWSR